MLTRTAPPPPPRHCSAACAGRRRRRRATVTAPPRARHTATTTARPSTLRRVPAVAAAATRLPTRPSFLRVEYESLGSELRPVDPKSAEFKMVKTYSDNTQGHRKCAVEEVG